MALGARKRVPAFIMVNAIPSPVRARVYPVTMETGVSLCVHRDSMGVRVSRRAAVKTERRAGNPMASVHVHLASWAHTVGKVSTGHILWRKQVLGTYCGESKYWAHSVEKVITGHVLWRKEVLGTYCGEK